MASHNHEYEEYGTYLANGDGPQVDHREHPVRLPTNEDPTATLAAFSAMRISDPVVRGNSAMSSSSYVSHTIDPISRSHTSMSNHTSQPHRPPRAATLPASPAPLNRPPRGASLGQPTLQQDFVRDNSLVGGSTHHPQGMVDDSETDFTSYYSHNAANEQSHHSSHQPTQHWPTDASNGSPAYHDQFYSAASDVLGYAPQPGDVTTPHAHGPAITYSDEYSGYTASHASLADTQGASSTQYSGYLDPYQPGPQDSSIYPTNHVVHPSNASLISVPSSLGSNLSGSNPSGSNLSYTQEEPEFERRPPLQRAGTSASVNLSTQKFKAVDLSAPPFTKEYIDQYRHRIKADPDPEAHFLYAKYLIDAAKKIGSEARDQRAVKKYRDLLITEALKVVRRLATQGQAYDEAQFFLANCYGTGMLGLQVDHEKAYHLYLQAAKQNHPAASYRVAVCNEIGAGTRREPPRAAAFYRKAASLGDTPAMYKLGMILLNGALGEERNPREAINWLRRAAEQADEDNPHALHELGLLHEMTNGQLVPYDPAYARSLFTQAAHLGYTQSQYKLGQCFEYGTLTCPVDPRRSIAWYTKAAEKGFAEAELALSGWYLTGSEGVLKQSDSEAYLWARRAANKGLSKAEYAVGYYAEVGIGIKQDVEFAKRWYMRAAAQGNKRAMNRLTEMKRLGNKRGNMARPTRQQTKDECVIS